jgi:hypothetical protein
MKRYHILFLSCLILAFGCKPQPKTQLQSLTAREQQLLDSLQIDPTLVTEIRQYNSSEIEPFHYSLSKIIKEGKEKEADPIHLKGIVFAEEYKKANNLVSKLSKDFNSKGYSIFVVEQRFNIGNKPDNIAVLKTTDKYEVLRQIQTEGPNYDITNDSLLKIIKRFDNEYALNLVGASGDWCEFEINKEPTNWLSFAKEVYKVCPDVVDQGAGTVEVLANEMKRTKRLYFWWD